MKVLVVGGGSGGHVTPAVAVVRELLEIKPRTRVEFWTDWKYYKNVVKITTEMGVKWGGDERPDKRLIGGASYIRVRKIMAGKFRRYAGWELKDYFINWQITLKDLILGNIIGLIGFIGGLLQSLMRLFSKTTRPDVIFLKGGFVSLPVGLIARLLRIPYVLHESDAVPGLANRLLMKRAHVVCMGLDVGAKLEGISGALVFTGTPVAPEFKPISEARQRSLKKTLGFIEDRPLVVVTGGSQGSEHINEAIREVLPEMLKFTSVGLVAGHNQYEEMVDLKKYEEWDKARLQSNFRLWSFSTIMDEIMGAADVVVSRAGATTIAELAGLKKAVVLVPFEKLPGGHQVKNAERLVEQGAVTSIRDDRMVQQPGILLTKVRHLVKSSKERKQLAEKLHKQARPEAAKHLAMILIDVADGKMVDDDKRDGDNDNDRGDNRGGDDNANKDKTGKNRGGAGNEKR